jgi:hypothetical protein
VEASRHVRIRHCGADFKSPVPDLQRRDRYRTQ